MGEHRPPYTVECVTWRDARDRLSAVRRAVFVVEQGVPEDLEWDEHDAEAVHALASTATGIAVGTGRLLRDGHIGRMAVVSEWRRCGVGSAILQTLLGTARALRYAEVKLHAQTHALQFYARHGFATSSEEFMEAGIPHREMFLRLPC